MCVSYGDLIKGERITKSGLGLTEELKKSRPGGLKIIRTSGGLGQLNQGGKNKRDWVEAPRRT